MKNEELMKRTLGFVQVMQSEFFGNENLTISIRVMSTFFVVDVARYINGEYRGVQSFRFYDIHDDEKIKETYYKLKRYVAYIIGKTTDMGCLAGF